MNIAISGSTGYIAVNLIQKLESVNHKIIKIQRNVLYDLEELTHTISGIDAVIHLAGAPILQKWTDKNKTEILKSRIDSTQNIIKAINSLPAEERPKTFISASAVGIYKTNLLHSEQSTNYSDDFVGTVVKQWENASCDLDPHVRRVIFRIGIVIGKESKTIQKILPVFKLGLGGRIGSGKQPFPFVHIDDVTNAFFWANQNKEVSGIFNLVAPQNITNSEFTRALSSKLSRPAIFTVPATALKLIYGDAASLILESPQAIPEKLQDYGFRFKFPEIGNCLEEIMR